MSICAKKMFILKINYSQPLILAHKPRHSMLPGKFPRFGSSLRCCPASSSVPSLSAFDSHTGILPGQQCAVGFRRARATHDWRRHQPQKSYCLTSICRLQSTLQHCGCGIQQFPAERVLPGIMKRRSGCQEFFPGSGSPFSLRRLPPHSGFSHCVPATRVQP